MKKLLIIAIAMSLASCEKLGTKCWECEIKYLDLKTQKLIMTDTPLDVCDQTREYVKQLEFNGEFKHYILGNVRKLEYCEEK